MGKVEIREQTHQGVSTDHPSIVRFIKGAARRADGTPRPKEEIAKLAGMPVEVVDRHLHSK